MNAGRCCTRVLPLGGCTLQVSEDRLVSMLEQISEKQGGGSGPKITIQRRRAAFDDDD